MLRLEKPNRYYTLSLEERKTKVGPEGKKDSKTKVKEKRSLEKQKVSEKENKKKKSATKYLHGKRNSKTDTKAKVVKNRKSKEIAHNEFTIKMEK